MLRLPAHELENLLLDFDVLAALSKGTSSDDIRQRASRHAGSLLYWMVCKATLREMQIELTSDFPAEPLSPPAPAAPRGLSDVESYVRQHAYWSKHAKAFEDWRQAQVLQDRLRRWLEMFEGDLASGAWATSFSGKELFRALRSHVPGLDEAPRRPPQPTSTERDANLAKRVARKMRELGRVPEVLTELRKVLRMKADL